MVEFTVRISVIRKQRNKKEQQREAVGHSATAGVLKLRVATPLGGRVICQGESRDMEEK